MFSNSSNLNENSDYIHVNLYYLSNLGDPFQNEIYNYKNLGKPILKDRIFAWRECEDIEFIKNCTISADFALREFGYEF